jgi:hypothetical protein
MLARLFALIAQKENIKTNHDKNSAKSAKKVMCQTPS